MKLPLSRPWLLLGNTIVQPILCYLVFLFSFAYSDAEKYDPRRRICLLDLHCPIEQPKRSKGGSRYQHHSAITPTKSTLKSLKTAFSVYTPF
ncbi:hypothetical protein QBC37DRAFT_419615 [Rhypophila decipiens]|uniref:Uncharacterized protein n=1 Tax=Rhypophila decipiens TaxID=261697 RepID=A0AAN6YES9_9PEZI|nr:hypothetical protein QBC37DRAFT_419615 [Rhypophila decipiens]